MHSERTLTGGVRVGAMAGKSVGLQDAFRTYSDEERQSESNGGQKCGVAGRILSVL